MLRAPERQAAARQAGTRCCALGILWSLAKWKAFLSFLFDLFTFLEGGSYDQIYILKYLLWPHKYGWITDH